MKARFPAFLLPYCNEHMSELAVAAMSNWLRIHALVRKLPDNEQSMKVVGTMLVHEYNRKRGPRMDIVTRLYGRFSHIRYEVERVELGTRKSR